MSKGSRRRPAAVSAVEARQNWDKIFNKDKENVDDSRNSTANTKDSRRVGGNPDGGKTQGYLGGLEEK